MSIHRFMIIIAVGLSLTACQLREDTSGEDNSQMQIAKEQQPALPSDKQSGQIQLIKAADGSSYDITKLRDNAQAIHDAGANGKAVMDSCCKVDPADLSSRSAKFDRSYFNGYYYYYYPPYYYYPYNYGSYNYNYYNSYFCSYVFSYSWDSSCYGNLFGYSYTPTYTSSYNSNCYYCLLYGSSSSQTACLAGCYVH